MRPRSFSSLFLAEKLLLSFFHYIFFPSDAVVHLVPFNFPFILNTLSVLSICRTLRTEEKEKVAGA